METRLGNALPVMFAAVLACAPPAGEEERVVQEVLTDESNLALGGFDPVSYFSEEGPVPGSPAIEARWRGASFLFAFEENRARFEASPERFAPQFGGHCAFGLSLGQAVPADPKAWTVRDGKLYLNASRAVRLVWRLVPGVIGRAERNWASLRSES